MPKTITLHNCLTVLILMSILLFAGSSWGDEDVNKRIEKLEQELLELKELLKAQAEFQEETLEKLEVQKQAVRHIEQKTSGVSDTYVGGYGEINYLNYDGSTADEFDMQRFILFLGHKFSDKTRLFSEIEFEHAQVKGGESGGEVAMEQAYIEHTLREGLNFRAGLQIVPIGLLNEYHEPPIFYGVERNEIETRIIPSTWIEIGFGLNGKTINGLEYFAGVSTTPDASKFKTTSSSTGFKDMRVSGKQVTANDMGYFAGFNYTGIPGLKAGATIWTGNTGQNGQGKGTGKAELSNVDAPLTIWDAHIRYAADGFQVSALYAAGTLGDTTQINAAAGIAAGSDDAAPEDFSGWYIEAAYEFYRDGDYAVAPFVRYEDYNTQEKVASGFAIDPLNSDVAITYGLSWHVHPEVVFKLDYQDYDTNDGNDRTNIGIGWMF